MISLISEIKKKKKAPKYREQTGVVARGRGWGRGHCVKESKGYKLPDTK